MTSRINDAKQALSEAFEETPDHDKEAMLLGTKVVVASVVSGLIRTTIVYAIGRKIAPSLFSSWGKTFVINWAANLATSSYKISDEDKARLAIIREAQSQERLNAIRRYNDSEA